jgi:O-antigen ligase
MSSVVRMLSGKPESAEAAPLVLSHRRQPNEIQPAGADANMVRLFCAWVFLQCFQYTAVPSLEWEVGVTMSPDRVMFCVILFAYARRMSRTRPVSRPGTIAATMLEWFMLLFAFIGTASWLVVGADAAGTKFYFLTLLFNLSFLPTAAYFIARRLQYTRAILKEIRLFLAALGVYLGVTAVCEHFGVAVLVFPKYILDPKVGIQFGRSRGPFLDTIGDGGMLLVSFLFLTYLSSSLKGFKRAVTSFLTLLVVLGIYFTDTRAIWLGLAAIVATLFTLRTTMRRTAAMVGCAILLGFFSGVGGKFSAYEETLFSRRQNTVDYRLDNYEIAWRMFEKNPVFGIGFGRFRYEWANYFDRVDARTRDLIDGNHITLLGILAELGIIGFAVFVAILAFSALVCITAYRQLSEDSWTFERGFVVLGTSAFMSFFILGLTNDLRSAAIVSVSAFWLVGIATSIHSSYLASNSARRSGTQRLFAPRGVEHASVFSA